MRIEANKYCNLKKQLQIDETNNQRHVKPKLISVIKKNLGEAFLSHESLLIKPEFLG